MDALEFSKPVKTIMDDFFEKYPNAKRREDNGVPKFICVSDLGFKGMSGKNCVCYGNSEKCLKCWSRPLEESK